MFRMKLSDKELCPCGSGKMYADCCKGIELKIPAQTKKPAEVLLMEKMRKSICSINRKVASYS